VRNLEREIANICRKRAREVVEGKGSDLVKVTRRKVLDYLGPETFHWEVAERVNEPGIVVGLAWTAAGGDILFIEASRMPGRGHLTLTGQLGDVMKESVRAAWSYVRAHAKDFDIDPNFYKAWDAHVHVPAGSIPKDGPSAGVGMLTAIVSLLSGRRVKSGIAMTGEITLRGNVLPIGGIKEKVTAAHRAGLKHVILPFENKKDLEDVPEKVKKDLKISFVKEMSQVLNFALEKEAVIAPVSGPPNGALEDETAEAGEEVVEDVFQEGVVVE
jgi:ATP-dependent Lon protease